ncbi:MAG: hypothetical protein QME61_03030 [Patescibacteria group bacterium]|nr:hypothetical protein [Patescibacteria group bacterium]
MVKRVKRERKRAEEEKRKKKERVEYMNEQARKEKRVSLWFPDLGTEGSLSLEFVPLKQGKSELDQWVVVFSLGRDPKEYFSKYEEAFDYFKELYQKYNLEKNRKAYFEEQIAWRESRGKKLLKDMRLGIAGLILGFLAAGILGVLAAIDTGIIAGIVDGVIIATPLTITIWWYLREKEGSQRVRFLQKEIEELQIEKEKSPF